MLKNLMVPILVAFVLGMLAVPAFAAGGGKPGTPSDGGPIIVELDPGHGGTEIGAANEVGGVLVQEKDVNLRVANATAAEIARLYGDKYVVLLTRNGDVTMSRPDRYAKANGDGAKVMISIHHNGSTDPSVNFTTTYYTQKSDQPIANLAQQYLVEYLGYKNNGIRRDGFGMTVRPKMPSALTEAWFITNDTSTDSAVEPAAVAYVRDGNALVANEARALAQAIDAYFR